VLDRPIRVEFFVEPIPRHDERLALRATELIGFCECPLGRKVHKLAVAPSDHGALLFFCERDILGGGARHVQPAVLDECVQYAQESFGCALALYNAGLLAAEFQKSLPAALSQRSRRTC